MAKTKQDEFEKIMQNLEEKMTEMQATIQTMTTIIFCTLIQSDNKLVIKKEVVEEVVNREDVDKFEFEFKVLDNGDGELNLIKPEDVEGMKKVQAFRKTLPQ